MNRDNPEPDDSVAVTRVLADWISGTGEGDISAAAIEWAKHATLDWLAVAIAGSNEPLVRLLAEEFAATGDRPCALLARGRRAGMYDAALVNGAAGHALDFDDVAPRMYGHPSVPVMPAALALAQADHASGPDLLRAIVVGHEVEGRIGEMVCPGHYLHGFHTVGTVGTFGAAAACASLRRLDADRTANALGLAATQAAGLKCMFGTMAKPLHAGKAAMNGLMAAQLAARGFTAADSAIERAQGFARTMASQHNPFDASMDMRRGFAIETTLFKYHATCYLTHSTIEAIRLLREQHGVELDAMESMSITVAVNHRGVCDIAEPKTGLNVKFSIQHLAALALDGIDTAALDLYSDETARNLRYAEARRRVSLTFIDSEDRTTARVTLLTRDGRTLVRSADVAVPATDVQAQWARLVAKARSIAEPVIGPARFEQLVAAVRSLDEAPSLNHLLEAIQ